VFRDLLERRPLKKAIQTGKYADLTSAKR